MAAGQDAREPVDWPAVAAPIAAVAPWRPAAEPGQADPHETDWAGRGFSKAGPSWEQEAREAADAEAWGGRGPSGSYAEWLAEGRQPEPEAGA
jgi:hypothetical protein